MNLEEFIKEQQNKLIEFKEAWYAGNKRNPSACPLVLPAEDWQEQFNFFKIGDKL